jgi:hypothetical protein
LNSGFLITDAGLAIATAALPGGPYIHIAEFRVGSAYGYTPTRSQSALVGSTLYASAATAYTIIDINISQVMFIMPNTIGSWNFGEVGIYLQDGTLFAICVWDVPQEKIKAVGSQFGNTWKIKSLLKLAQAPAIVEVNLINSQNILEVPNWESLLAPSDQPTNSNIAIVHADDENGKPVLVVRDEDYDWGLIAYAKVFAGSVSDPGASATADTFTNPGIIPLWFGVPNATSRYLVKFSNGQIRILTNRLSDDTIQWATALGAPPVGAISIWQDISFSDAIYWADTYEYNKMILNFNPYWATPNGVYPGSNRGFNETAFPVLARKTTSTDWTILLNAIRNTSKTLGVDPAPVTGFNDFIYHADNAELIGLETVRERWDATVAQIVSLYANRNVVNLLYQALTAYAPETYSLYWGGTKNHYFDFTYADANMRQGMLNSGHALNITPSVTSPTSAAWVKLQTDFASFGAISLTPTGVTASASWHPTSIGLQNLTGTDQLLASFVNQLSWTVYVYGKIVGNAIRITFSMINLGGAYYYYYYASPGTINFAWSSRKASLLASPIQPTPLLTYTTG